LPANGVGGREISGDEVPDIRPGCLRILLWMFLAACASAMLLAVTNSLCQEVAVVPFLWVLPLALYLLSFILCFDSSRWYRRRWFLLLGAIASIAVLITAFRGVQLKIAWHVISYGMFLFFFCMTCHGELVRLKPTTRYLTLFYLMVALGGAVGGIFVGIVAPMFFKGYWEFHIVLMAGWILLALVLAFDMTSPFHRGDRLHFYLLLFVLGFVIAQFSQLLFGLSLPLPVPGIVVSILLSAVVTGVFAIVTRNAAFVDSKYWPRILVGAIIFIAECFVLQRVRSNDSTSVRMDRNFYGVTTVMRRVTAEEPRLPILHLMHGQINHGAQILDDNWRTRPISYYSEETGVGLAFRFHPRRQKNEPVNAGVLGLGVGTLASYAREQDRFKFYEINPIVAGYSTGEDALFSYIKESCGQVDVVMGDARVSLERELQSPNAFDVLVMDVFSSDAVPVHLLTREAFEIYMRHLRDEDSIMAIHISNRFLDLRDLVANTARQFGLETIVIDYERKAAGNTASLWCLLTRSKTFLNHPELAKGQRIKGSATGLIWTDDYSNLFRVLK